MHLDVVVDDLDAAEAERARARGDEARAPAGDDLPGVPRPGRPPVLPLHQLSAGGDTWRRTGLPPPNAPFRPGAVPSRVALAACQLSPYSLSSCSGGGSGSTPSHDA